MRNKKPWSFCKTPKEKCTMNYCDDNGCMNRKRHLVTDGLMGENCTMSYCDYDCEDNDAKLKFMVLDDEIEEVWFEDPVNGGWFVIGYSDLMEGIARTKIEIKNNI